MTRVVDDDLIAALDGSGENEIIAGSGRINGGIHGSLGGFGALDIELEAEVIGRGVGRGIAADLGGILICIIEALNVGRAVAVGQRGVLDVIQIVACVAGNNLPFAGRVGVVGVVRQLKVGLAVRLGQPHHDLVCAVDEAEGAVAVVNNRPNQRCVRRDNLVVGRSDRLGHQVPVVVGLVLDCHAVTRVVDNNLVAALNGSGENEIIAGLGGAYRGIFRIRRFLSAADGADTVHIVVSDHGDHFGLGLAAERAGVGHNTGRGAGCFLGDFAFVPLVLARSGLLCENREDLCKLSTGRIALRVQHAVRAADDLKRNCPVKSFSCIVGDFFSVGEALEIVFCDFGFSGITPEHGNELLTQNQSVRNEGRLGNAIDDTVLLCPCDAVLVPILLQVGKGGRLNRRNDRICQTIENHRCHSTRAGAVRCEGVFCHAVHELRIMLINISDIRCKPVSGLHVLERLNILRSRKHGRKNACDHGNYKHECHNLLDCVFHCLSSLNSKLTGYKPILVFLFYQLFRQ